MQARQETTDKLAFSRTHIQSETNGFFGHFFQELLAAKFFQGSNDFIRVAGIKVLAEALVQLKLEFLQGQERTKHWFGGSWIVSSLISLIGSTREDVFIGIFGDVVEWIIFVERFHVHVGRIEHFFPLALAVASLFLEGTIVLAGIFLGGLLACNISLGGSFLYFRFVIILLGKGFVRSRRRRLLGYLGLDLRRNSPYSLPGGIVHLPLGG